MWQLRSGNSPRRLIEILGLAAVYFVYGRLGLLLAIPPGTRRRSGLPRASHSPDSSFSASERGPHPPRILRGQRRERLRGRQRAEILRSTVLPATIAGGACFQALLGARLVRRFVERPTSLGREKDVVKILAIGGPFACLVNATVSVASLALHGRIGESEIPFSWWTWWVGDTIGVLVFAPLVLLWAEQPDEERPAPQDLRLRPARLHLRAHPRALRAHERLGAEARRPRLRAARGRARAHPGARHPGPERGPRLRGRVSSRTRRRSDARRSASSRAACSSSIPGSNRSAWCPAPSGDPTGECARLEYLNPPCTPDGRGRRRAPRLWTRRRGPPSISRAIRAC
jgi:hypothetical protein